EVSFTGGVYVYSDGFENGERTIFGLPAGNVQIKLEDNCGNMVETNVEIKQLEELAITNAEPIDICFGGFSSS
ncbi:hypothetical protein, partial [Aestuariibaculum suncheonense]